MDTKATLGSYVQLRRERMGKTLPAPPDRARIARAHAALSTYRDVLDVMTPDELRTFVSLIGTVIVGPDGVTMRYSVDDAYLVPEPCVRAVPRWGKGLR